MELSVFQLILVFVAASISGMGSILDEFQTHRPLIACTIMGAVLGDIKTGIMLGGALELLALGWMNIGAAVAPDAALASTVSTILVIVGKQDINTAIGLAIPIAAAGQVLTYIVRAITVGVQHAADKSIQDGDLKRLDWLHCSALLIQAMRIAIPTLLVAMTTGTDAVQSMLNAIPEVITTGLKIAGGFIAIVGYAMVVNMMRVGYLMPFFFLGFIIAGFTSYNLVAFGGLGLIIAFVYINIHPKYNQPKTVANAAPVVDELDNRLD